MLVLTAAGAILETHEEQLSRGSEVSTHGHVPATFPTGSAAGSFPESSSTRPASAVQTSSLLGHAACKFLSLPSSVSRLRGCPETEHKEAQTSPVLKGKEKRKQKRRISAPRYHNTELQMDTRHLKIPYAVSAFGFHAVNPERCICSTCPFVRRRSLLEHKCKKSPLLLQFKHGLSFFFNCFPFN